MKYVSVKTGIDAGSFRNALLRGIAPDGSLYIPATMPKLPEEFIESIGEYSLHEIGFETAKSFISDIPDNDLNDIIKKSWSFKIPLVNLENDINLLELFHGPTLAFKDVGARFLANALDYYMKQEKKRLTIIVATSGDTGSAVAHGFLGADNIDVFVVYPSGKISLLQEKQMTTLGGNINAIEVKGAFDDCQRLVKQALNDKSLIEKKLITTANSINLGRLVPQIVYYLWAYAQWKNMAGKKISDKINPTIVVPSGNFGNLTAGLYANIIGMPAKSFIAATNVNDIVPEYLKTGVYSPRPSVMTYSNAMDVGDPSNWSRIEALYNNNYQRIKSKIRGVSITDEETLAEIRNTYKRTGYITDPHTAVGIAAARKSQTDSTIVTSTAHPAKFQDVIKKALGIEIGIPEELAKYRDLPKKSVAISADYEAFKELILSSATGSIF